jgi:hypothetical protein
MLYSCMNSSTPGPCVLVFVVLHLSLYTHTELTVLFQPSLSQPLSPFLESSIYPSFNWDQPYFLDCNLGIFRG